MKSLVLIQSLLALLGVNPSSATQMNLLLTSTELKRSVSVLDQKFGVSEDVLRYIHEVSSPNSDQEKALVQLGQDYNRALLHLNKESLSLKNAKRILQSEFCVRALYSDHAYNLTSKIHSLTLNSHQRARLGIRLNTYLGRAIPYLPQEENWIKDCRFVATGRSR